MRENIRKKLGDILIEAKKITYEQLDDALKKQATNRKKLGETLINSGYITENEIIETLSKQLSIRIIDLEKTNIDPTVARKIPKEVAKKYNLLPFSENQDEFFVAMSDPLNVFALDDIKFITQKHVIPFLSKESVIKKAIEIYYNVQITEKALEDLKKEYEIQIAEKSEELANDVQNAPAVRLTNSILNQAISIMASDIHIEPFETMVRVRFRVDGVLLESTKIPLNLYSSVLTRIKIMAGINIAERRIPQDGRIEMELNNKSFDFRVSSLPTVFGEKLVIRILDRSSFLFKREMLGFSKWENTLMDKIIKASYGIILLTGPTGSGKTTTLYTLLNELNTTERNIVTVEDPVEYMMEGINQVQVNNKAGLTFAAGLRSILRQDPDVIMIGEIRDEETAHIAVRAAITGHIVLSTLHTNDASSSIVRMIDMGVEPYLISEAISGIIAQRLVRRLCPTCKEGFEPDDADIKLLGSNSVKKIYRAKGCPACSNTGYKGRMAVHEVMYIGKETRVLVEQGKNAELLRELAIKNGMVTLLENCRQLVIKGETSINEMVRTVYARD